GAAGNRLQDPPVRRAGSQGRRSRRVALETRTLLPGERPKMVKFLFVIVAAALALGSETWPGSAPPAPLAGFSFSPQTSESAGRDPAQDLTWLLDATQPDLVRLPVYWESVEPTPDKLDFSEIDSLLKAVARHNHRSSVHARVVL